MNQDSSSSQERQDLNYISGCIIGHVDHGKTTFTAALSQAGAEFYGEYGNKAKSIENIDNAPEERQRGITISVAHVPLNFVDRQVTINDCPGHQDYVTNMIAGAKGSDFGILLVAATEGVAAQTREHVSLAAVLGVKEIFVVYNKMDSPEAEELIELVEMEVEQLLSEYDLTIAGKVRISALKALTDSTEREKMKEVLEFIKDFNIDRLLESQEFRLVINEIFNPKGQGTIVSGIVMSGKLNQGEDVEIIGMSKPMIAGTAIKIEAFKQSIPSAVRGSSVGIQVKNVTKENIRKGMTMVRKGRAYTVTTF